jgi:hypothetical protein
MGKNDKFTMVRIERDVLATLMELAAADDRSAPMEIRFLVNKEFMNRSIVAIPAPKEAPHGSGK